MRNYKIVVDSCCDLPKEYRNNEHIEFVPLTLMIDGEEIIDDESFNQADFIDKVAKSPNCPRSASPSPGIYASACEGKDTDVYIVTLSSKLSGSYNSAVLGVNLYKEDGGDNKVHVFDSESASSGEAIIVEKILECVGKGFDFDTTVKLVEKFKEGSKTYFVLETLESLKKNGRLTNLQAFIANALHVKPIMGSKKGEIIKLKQERGIKKAIESMCNIIAENIKDAENKVLAISHCNCRERAEFIKKKLEERFKFKKVMILETAGVATLYANNGGVVVAV